MLTLVPRPARVQAEPAVFTLSPTTGLYAPQAPAVADLVRELLGPVTGFAFRDAAEPGPDMIELLVDPEVGEPASEAYWLVCNASGITATAGGETGLRWAVQALRQLMPPEVYGPAAAGSDAVASADPDSPDSDSPDSAVGWTVAGAEIVDAPRFPWRGLMVDVGRWYKPVAWLHTVVDLLALHRMNVLHLHLTDDQGWRFEVRRYPRLTEVGAFRRESPLGHGADRTGDGLPHGGFYTQQELRDLVAYAARRGVTVVPEIDLPGHMQAAIAAYPELGNDPERQLEVWTGFGISPHVLNVEESTVEFVQHVLDEVLEVFPAPYIHLGGDEVSAGEWAVSARARARLDQLGLAEPEDLLGWWIGRLTEHVENRGRRVVLWDELVGEGTPKQAVIMAWRDEDRVRAALAAGHDVIAAPHTEMYLNYPASRAAGEPLSIADGSTTDGVDALPLSRIYAYEPQPVDVDGSLAQARGRVLGPQGNLWTEYAATPARAEYDLMPRLAAVAEVAWGTATDLSDLERRLAGHVSRMDAAGIRYRPLD